MFAKRNTQLFFSKEGRQKKRRGLEAAQKRKHLDEETKRRTDVGGNVILEDGKGVIFQQTAAAPTVSLSYQQRTPSTHTHTRSGRSLTSEDAKRPNFHFRGHLIQTITNICLPLIL